MEKKNNGIVILLVILVIGLSGYILYDKDVLGLKGDKKDNTEVNNTLTNNNEDKISVNNLNMIELEVYDESTNYEKFKKLELKIVDGELQAYLNYEKVDVKGIEGKAKAFLYQLAGCSVDSDMNIIVLNDINELFVADVNHYAQENYLTFKKQSLDKEISDITKLDFTYAFSTCGSNDLAVVTKDNKIYPYNYDYQNKNFSIYDLDVTNFKKSIYVSYIVYKDNSIGIFDTNGKYDDKFNERLKYNNIELKASKFYFMKKSDSIGYVVSDNKLYKLDTTYDGPQLLDAKVSLVSDKRIIGESFIASDNSNTSNCIITFEDYSTYNIGEVSQMYNVD